MDDAEAYAALPDVIRAATGTSMVTHWVLVAVAIGEDGHDATHRIASPGLPLWMQHGLLSYEAAATTPQPDWTWEDDA